MDATPEDNPLCTRIRRIADAEGHQALNDALYDFAAFAFPLLEPTIACRLRQRRVPGMIDDVEDVLGRLLEKLGDKSPSFRGTCDAQAQKWLEKIADSIIDDARKTPLRRRRLLLHWLAGQGYGELARQWGEPRRRGNGVSPDEIR